MRAAEQPAVEFRSVRLILDLESTASSEQLETLVRLTERYGVAYQTLVGGVLVSVERRESSGASVGAP